ncbi:MAG: carboxypeptidase regulatory-like domain-containing protein [Acidobacteria bacterium]|nr:carboxypeptidase regulatory-like domain-containing protein [Acidobacteriota bacterium]
MVAAVLLSSGGADSYRFVANEMYVNEDDFTTRAAVRWDPAVWGPGETLEWVIADEPGWTSPWVEEQWDREGPAPFETPEDAVPLLAWGLSAWTNLESADIRWEVTRVEQVEGFVRDGVNTVVARIDPEILGQVRPWMRLVNGEWKMEECDIRLSPLMVSDMLSEDVFHLGSLVHEFGHCLPLHHSAAYGDIARTLNVFPDSRGHPPQMAYSFRSFPEPTLDDAVGASLLRPAPGWLSTTGAISGRITVEGRKATHVMVFAARMTGAGVQESVSVMTEPDGDFTIEGLIPGVYFLRASSMIRPDAHPYYAYHLQSGAAILDARDKILLDPVTVRAGRETAGIRLDLPRGRQGRDWQPKDR